MATVMVGSARIDENGKAYGGAAGDQTGKEVSKQAWYKHSKGWRVFRAKNAGVADKIAKAMKAACDNNKIGYDQWQRNTLYTQAQKVGFDISKVTTKCETDCSALVRVCCAYAGIMGLPSDFRTGNMPSNLLKTGAFVELTGAKYTNKSDYLGAGDILVTKKSGHTVVVLNDGDSYEGTENDKKVYKLGDRVLKKSMSGDDVKELQKALISLGYSCGISGVDGSFGSATQSALKKFQKAKGLEVDGMYGPASHKAMAKALDALDNGNSTKHVLIVGGNCYIRSTASVTGKILGVAYKGNKLTYGGATASNGWQKVKYKNATGWVSGKYSKLED